MEENERREGVLKQHFALYAKKPSIKDCFVTVFIFMICTIIGLLFQKLHFTDTNIVTIYILGVLITSILTDGYLCSIAGSFLSVVLFCFFLTEPRMSFQTYAVGYPVTFAIMLVCSVLAGTLSAKLKMHARISSQLAFRTQVLFDTDRLLQKARSSKEMLRVTCTQLVRLLNRDIVAYIVEEGKLSQGQVFYQNKEGTNQQFLIPEEQKIARWVYENNKRAGVGTNYFKNAKCLYLAIRIGDHVYGVIGIPANKDVLDSVEYSILLSVVNECALAMENLRNAIEKEKFKFTDQLLDEVIAESLRHISRKHDEYTIVTKCEELILVRMDVQLIIQVLVNLIDNAIKYTPKGSKICIRGMKCNGKAQICVEDDGPGIADEMKPYIFEMFYTGKSTIADSQRSLGLGLSLCQSIIEAHDGRLILTDNTPRGCIFTFTLPLSEVTLNE